MTPPPNWEPLGNDRDSCWNIDADPQAFENAKRWTRNMIECWKDRATWIVPRSFSIYDADKPNKVLTKRAGGPEPSIRRVFEALGWTVKEPA